MIRAANVDLETTKVSHFSCPHCSKRLRHDSCLSGRTVKCPKCGNAFRMPRVAVVSAKPATPRQEAPKQVAEQYRRRQTQQRTGRRWTLVFAVIGLGLVGAAVAFKFADGKNDAAVKSPEGELVLSGTADGEGNTADQLTEEEPVSSGIVERVIDGVTGRTARDKIIGKWQEIGKTEIVEFFPEGTMTITDPSEEFSATGDYRFLNDRNDRLRLDLGGLKGKLAGPLIFTVAVTSDKLEFTFEGNGEISRYQRFSEKRGSNQGGQLTFDPNDLVQTNRWVQRTFASVPSGNLIVLKETIEGLNRQCESFVGQEIIWQMPVLAVTSEHVIVDGSQSHLEVGFVDSNGRTRHERLGLTTFRDILEIESGAMMLKIDEQISRTEARSLEEGTLLSVRGTIHKIGPKGGKIGIFLRDVRSASSP